MVDTFILLFIFAVCFNLGMGLFATVAQAFPCSTVDDFTTDTALKDCTFTSLGVGNQSYPSQLTFTGNDPTGNSVVGNLTNPDCSNVETSGLTNVTGCDVTSNAFVDAWQSLLNFGSLLGFGIQVIFNAFTGSFFFDVIGTGAMGIAYPAGFLEGIKVLYAIALIGFLAVMILGRQANIS